MASCLKLKWPYDEAQAAVQGPGWPHVAHECRECGPGVWHLRAVKRTSTATGPSE